MQRITELETELKERNKEVLARDRVITELRLRLPASAERDQAIAKATTVAGQRVAETAQDYEGEKAVRVAQSTVHHLQVQQSLYLCIILLNAYSFIITLLQFRSFQSLTHKSKYNH